MMILFMVAIAAVNAGAQEKTQPPPQKKTPEERAENMTKRMAKELALTDAQQTQVKALILKRERQREETMKAHKAEMEKIDAEFKTILTPDQYQKFEQKKEEMKQKRQEKRMHPGPPPAPDNNVPPPAPPVQK